MYVYIYSGVIILFSPQQAFQFVYVALKKRNSLSKETTLRLLLTTTTVLPLSWFIGPFYSLCQILTKDLTNKMLMHVKKNYLIGFVFEHSFEKYNVW